MRLFIGIALSPAVIAELATLTARLRPKPDSLRWTEPESWHITLYFLGSSSQEGFDCLLARLGELRFPPVPVGIDELGFFDRAGVFPNWFRSSSVSPTPSRGVVSCPKRAPSGRTLLSLVPRGKPAFMRSAASEPASHLGPHSRDSSHGSFSSTKAIFRPQAPATRSEPASP
jgi:hypothetical protein